MLLRLPRFTVRRLCALAAREDGYTLSELLTVMAILGTVLTGLTTVFVSAANAEVDLNKRFQAQQEARIALDRIRAEVHCARVITGTAAEITLTLPLQCSPVRYVSWCTETQAGFTGLYRKPGTTCDENPPSVKVADYLTATNVFSFTPQSPTSLAMLRLNFPVDINPDDQRPGYRLVADAVLRNSTRS